jgi:hypothetical protein
LHLKYQGRELRRYKPARIQLEWSKDGQSATIKGKGVKAQTLHWDDYCLWVRKVIAKAERQLQGLFCGEQPSKLPLLESLFETLTDRSPGGAFFEHPQNKKKLGKLTDAFLERIKWKFTKEQQKRGKSREKDTSPKDWWDKPKLDEYYEKHTEFLQTLLVLMQITGGQPARGPELLSVKIYNTESTHCNIYIHKGVLSTVQQYSKNQSNIARPFYTVHHFPPCVSQILYKYLIYIRPFVRWTEKDLEIEPEQPGYLWPARHNTDIEAAKENIVGEDEDDDEDDEDDDDIMISSAHRQGYWLTQVISAELRALCHEYGLSVDLNMQTLRHWVVGFSKKHILRPGQSAAALKKLKQLVAFQAGHLVEHHDRTYSTDANYPSTLQPETLDEYYIVSERYFEFSCTVDIDSEQVIWQEEVLAMPLKERVDTTLQKKRRRSNSKLNCQSSSTLSSQDSSPTSSQDSSPVTLLQAKRRRQQREVTLETSLDEGWSTLVQPKLSSPLNSPMQADWSTPIRPVSNTLSTSPIQVDWILDTLPKVKRRQQQREESLETSSDEVWVTPLTSPVGKENMMPTPSPLNRRSRLDPLGGIPVGPAFPMMPLPNNW